MYVWDCVGSVERVKVRALTLKDAWQCVCVWPGRADAAETVLYYLFYSILPRAARHTFHSLHTSQCQYGLQRVRFACFALPCFLELHK